MSRPLQKVLRPVGLVLVCLLVVAFGGFMVWRSVNAWYSGNNSSAAAGFLFGAAFIGFSLAPLYHLRRQKRGPDPTGGSVSAKPWLAREDWAAGRVKSSDPRAVKFYWIFALAFCGLSTPALLALPGELRHGNYKVLLAVLFPLAGLGFLVAAIRTMLVRRRFGDCVFNLATVPAALGGTLEGVIQTGARLRPEHGLHLRLSCVRRVTTGGRNRSTQETILWQDEKVLKADLPEPEPGRTGIPVFFRLPPDQPEWSVSGDEQFYWRLEAAAKMPGPDFHATFDVPVFQAAETPAAARDEPDPTAAYQMPVEKIRLEEHSRIRVGNGPRGGREFFFPAARNPGTALGLTAFLLIWSGVVWLMLHTGASRWFCVVFGGVDVLVFCLCFSLWFKQSRVTIDSGSVTSVNRWLLLRRAWTMPRHEVTNFQLKTGMTSGRQAYQDVQLVTRAGKEMTVASGIKSGPEADWLLAELNRALGGAGERSPRNSPAGVPVGPAICR